MKLGTQMSQTLAMPSRGSHQLGSPNVQGSMWSDGGDWGIFKVFTKEVVTNQLRLMGRKETVS